MEVICLTDGIEIYRSGILFGQKKIKWTIFIQLLVTYPQEHAPLR